jgi:hypothetical protein
MYAVACRRTILRTIAKSDSVAKDAKSGKELNHDGTTKMLGTLVITNLRSSYYVD